MIVRDPSQPRCPGPKCPMCSGEACNKCGAGCWNNQASDCEHDCIERHEGHAALYEYRPLTGEEARRIVWRALARVATEDAVEAEYMEQELEEPSERDLNVLREARATVRRTIERVYLGGKP